VTQKMAFFRWQGNAMLPGTAASGFDVKPDYTL
jgi:hypothetical protein